MMCEIYSKLTIKTPENSRHRSGIFNANYEQFLHVALCSAVSTVDFEQVISNSFSATLSLLTH